MTRRGNGHATLADLVEHAICAEDELAALEAEHRVSARGLLEASLAQAGCTPEEVLALQARIDRDPEAHPACVHFVAGAVRLLTNSAVTVNAPMPVNRMICVAPQRALDQVRAEGVDLRLLWCLGVLIASTKHPDAFGEVDDMAAHQARIDGARAGLGKAHEAIKSAPIDMSRDVIVEPDIQTERRNAGYAKITHRLAPGVPVWAPPEHLTAAVRRQRAQPLAAE